MYKRTLLLLTVLLTAIMPAIAESYKLVENIPYQPASSNRYAEERCRLDVYYPEGKTDCPVIVWFHGGGLEGGEKFIPGEIKHCGYVVVGVNYRLLPKCGVAECIDDAAAAVAWTFGNIAKYGGSDKKIFIAGHSAGGYLASMIGLEKKWLARYGVDADRIAGLFPFSGQAITHFNVRKQQGVGPLQPTIDEFAPISHLRADAPPVIIISGDRELELYGRYEEQAYFWRMLKLVGHSDVMLYEMQGFNHGAMASPAFHILKDQVRRILGQ